MSETWHSVDDVKISADQITAKITVSRNSPWFDGHFPGFPVLPGIAQISMISDTVKRLDEQSGGFTIREIKKVRFRQLITGDAILDLAMTKEKNSPSQYKFKLLQKDQIICNGTVLLGTIT